MASQNEQQQPPAKKLTPAQKKQQELFQEMAEQLSQDFDKKLDNRLGRFEEMLAAITSSVAKPDSQPPSKKRARELADTGTVNFTTQADVHTQPHQVSESVNVPSVSPSIANLPSQNGSQPAIGQTPEVTSAIAQSQPVVNNNIASNTWLLAQTRQHYADKPTQPLPTSACDLPADPDIEDHVQQILATASHQLSQGAGKPGLFPHRYVYKGPERRRVGLNTLSVQEHVTGIFLMIDDDRVPNDIKPHLLNHIQEVLDDSCHYDWPNAVRRWSEEVFSAIAENRLKGGWKAHNTIQMMRMSMSKTYAARLPLAKDTAKDNFQRVKPPSLTQQQEILKGGPPCFNFNRPQGCSLPSGHVVNGKKMIHICTYCMFNMSAANPHSELECRNKQRFPPPQY